MDMMVVGRLLGGLYKWHVSNTGDDHYIVSFDHRLPNPPLMGVNGCSTEGPPGELMQHIRPYLSRPRVEVLASNFIPNPLSPEVPPSPEHS